MCWRRGHANPGRRGMLGLLTQLLTCHFSTDPPPPFKWRPIFASGPHAGPGLNRCVRHVGFTYAHYNHSTRGSSLDWANNGHRWQVGLCYNVGRTQVTHVIFVHVCMVSSLYVNCAGLYLAINYCLLSTSQVTSWVTSLQHRSWQPTK